MSSRLLPPGLRLPILACLLATGVALALPGLGGVSHAQQPAASRTWSDASGTYTVEASMLGVNAGKVSLLRADGRRVDVPLDKLSPADQQYVQTMLAAAAPAGGGKPLPFDTSLVSSDFAGAMIIQPQRLLQSPTFQALSKLSPAPPQTTMAGVDVSKLEWLVVLFAPSAEEAVAAEASPFGPEVGPMPAKKQENVAVIAVSAQPFDRNAMLASPELAGVEEGMMGDKVHWKAAADSADPMDVVFLSDRVALAAPSAMMPKVIQAQGSGKQLIGIMGQLDLNHDIAIAFISPDKTTEAPMGGGGDPFSQAAQGIETAVVYVDLGAAPKISASLTAADEQTAAKTKEGLDGAMGFVNLTVTQVLFEQWKQLPVDATPLASLVTETLGSFKTSVQATTLNVSIATPADFVERASKCGPIIQAAIMQQLQLMQGPPGGAEPSPFGPEGGAEPNPFGPGGATPPPGAGENNPFGPGGAQPAPTQPDPTPNSPF